MQRATGAALKRSPPTLMFQSFVHCNDALATITFYWVRYQIISNSFQFGFGIRSAASGRIATVCFLWTWPTWPSESFWRILKAWGMSLWNIERFWKALGRWFLLLILWTHFSLLVWDWVLRCSLDDLETSSVSLLPCDLLYCFVCLGGFALPATSSLWSRVVLSQCFYSGLVANSGRNFKRKGSLEDECWKHMSELGQISRHSPVLHRHHPASVAMTSKHGQNGSVWDQFGKAESGLAAWLSCFDVVLLTIADRLLTMNLQ